MVFSSMFVRILILATSLIMSCTSFLAPSPLLHPSAALKMTSGEEEAARLQKRAEELREQIRKMEESLGDSRPRNYDIPTQPSVAAIRDNEGMSLQNKRVLVVGSNGRLGSMVCRHLLRNHPTTQVIAAVHYVGENSPTARGYGRLSYEVGAEDGIGRIGPAWSSEERTATFQYSDATMKDYNLKNLRIVEVELLDPIQCQTVTEGVDSIIWCATDFNANQPRAISGLNLAFLFRAVANPTKGRVEIEGLRNILGGLVANRRDSRRDAIMGKPTSSPQNDPTNVILVSAAPQAYEDFETPFGTFNGLKREGEQLLKNEFPSLTHTILQMGRYEDNFVDESLDILMDQGGAEDERRRRINRRDAARAAVDALINEQVKGKTVQVWTALRG
jgi:hypothetical protein